MEVRTTARRVKVTPAIQDHLEQRLAKLQRYVPELDKAAVKLSLEKHRYKVEILLHVRHRDRVAQEEAGDLTAAIDGAANRLETQLRRLKDRSNRAATRRTVNGPVHRSAARAALEPDVKRNSSTETKTPARPRTAKRKAIPLEERPEVVRSRMPAGKPLSVEEAADELLESNLEFLVYIDSKSECPCVLYRRGDGRLGLIEARR
jgi:putative sigma-54 modulation protein